MLTFVKSEGTVFRLPFLFGLALVFVSSCPASYLWVDPTGSTLINFAAPADDALATVDLAASGYSFAFPFEGSSYTQFTASSAGFVWLGGSNFSQCCITSNQTAALKAFNGGPARIAPAWMYLDEAAGGQVEYKVVNNPGGSQSFVLTYLNVPIDSIPGDAAYYASFQVQLISTGDIVFTYQHFDSGTLIGSNVLIGLTPGAVSSSQSVNLTNLISGTPLTVGQSVYDYLTSTNVSSSPLTGESIVIHPSQNGWQIGPDFQTADVPEPSAFLLVLSAALLFLVQKRFGRINL